MRFHDDGLIENERVDELVPNANALTAANVTIVELPLRHDFLVTPAGETHSALPRLERTQPIVTVAGTASAQYPPVVAGDRASDAEWRSTGTDVIRWISSALAVLLLAGIALVFALPGLRRRLLFPDAPPLPARQP